jgi:hypothetical protein
MEFCIDFPYNGKDYKIESVEHRTIASRAAIFYSLRAYAVDGSFETERFLTPDYKVAVKTEYLKNLVREGRKSVTPAEMYYGIDYGKYE